jgi:hypothetical protein
VLSSTISCRRRTLQARRPGRVRLEAQGCQGILHSGIDEVILQTGDGDRRPAVLVAHDAPALTGKNCRPFSTFSFRNRIEARSGNSHSYDEKRISFGTLTPKKPNDIKLGTQASVAMRRIGLITALDEVRCRRGY